MMNSSYFFEVEHFQASKKKMLVCGDVFLSKKIPSEGRIISVLSDGLGSGIKASVLATLTTTMAAKFISSDIDIRRAAKIIMETLPICKVRKIGYSTFTIIDQDNSGKTRIIEHDNPPFILMRNGKPAHIHRDSIKMNSSGDRDIILNYSQFNILPGDRIVVFSDGVSQSGIGKKKFPLGWGNEAIEEYLTELTASKPDISAREMAHRLVHRALLNDDMKAADDITCGVIYARNPRKTMVFTGPPVHRESDCTLAKIAGSFNGKKIICGGTTAGIIAREMGEEVTVDISELDPDIPPCSMMKGFDLITEGTITMGRVAALLEETENFEQLPKNAATKLVLNLINSDIVKFVVGTRINDAHQDPSLPRELEIRRNIVKRIAKLLEDKFLKQTEICFI